MFSPAPISPFSPPRRAALLPGMKRKTLRGLYSPELLESRIAPAAIVVTSLKDDGTDTSAEITLREAIGLANDQVTHPGADTITFDPALIPVNPPGPLVVSTLHATIVLTGQIEITDTLILKGPGVDKLAISGNDNSRIFDIFDGDDAVLHPTTISGLSFEHGNAGNNSDDGGAIRSTESLILKNTTFSNNYAYDGGGAVYVDTKGIVSVTNTAFLNNTAQRRDGGALYASARGGITVVKSLVSGNRAADNDFGGMNLSIPGGGTKPGHILVDGVNFLGNSAEAGTGGGMWAENQSVKGKTTVKNSTFTGNTSTGNGGALYLTGGIVLVSGCTFSDNAAGTVDGTGAVLLSGSGGALASSGTDSLTIKGSKFFRNSASEDGGGIQLGGQGLTSIAGSIFTGNKASNGGGISASGVGITVAGSLFTGNSASSGGGGVFIINGTAMLVKGSTLSGNVAGGNGGGVYAEFGSALTFSGGTVSGNSSGSVGGGIFAGGIGVDATDLTVTGTVFSGNTAAGSGGAVHAGGDGVILIKGVKVLGNMAGNDDGGGMFLESTSRITVSGSLFAGNHAGNYGGGLLLAGTGVRLVTGSSFLANSADNLGGGIFVQSSASAASILKSKVTGNIAGSFGGGIQGFSAHPPVLTGSVLTGNFASNGANLYLG